LTDDADVSNILSNAGGGAKPTSHVTKLPPRQNKTYGNYRPMTVPVMLPNLYRVLGHIHVIGGEVHLVLLPLMRIPPLNNK